MTRYSTTEEEMKEMIAQNTSTVTWDPILTSASLSSRLYGNPAPAKKPTPQDYKAKSGWTPKKPRNQKRKR